MSKKKPYIPFTDRFMDKLETMTEEYGEDDCSPKTRTKHIGVELEFISPEGQTFIAGHLLMAGIDEGVIVKLDGSINAGGKYGIEVCIIATQKKIAAKIITVCTKLKELGCTVNDSCGLHVHLDMRSRTPSTAYRNLVAELPELTKMVEPSRLRNTYCKLNEDKELNNRYHSDRYYAINPCSLEEHDTLEVRLHEGSLDEMKINNWITTLVKVADKKKKVG